jgi:hypothetical protein
MFLSPKQWDSRHAKDDERHAQTRDRHGGLRSRERNRVIDGGLQTTERSHRPRTRQCDIRLPFPTRARQPVRALLTRDLRQVFGLMGFGFDADLLGAASQAKPSAIRAVRSQLPLRGSPGMRAMITARSPGSLFSPTEETWVRHRGWATRYCGSREASTLDHRQVDLSQRLGHGISCIDALTRACSPKRLVNRP